MKILRCRETINVPLGAGLLPEFHQVTMALKLLLLTRSLFRVISSRFPLQIYLISPPTCQPAIQSESCRIRNSIRFEIATSFWRPMHPYPGATGRRVTIRSGRPPGRAYRARLHQGSRANRRNTLNKLSTRHTRNCLYTMLPTRFSIFLVQRGAVI